MRTILIVVGALILVAAGAVLLLMQPVRVKTMNSPLISADGERLHKHVEKLAGTFSPRDYQHLENLNRVRAYIATEFSRAGAEVSQQVYTVQRHDYANVIARFGPESAARVVIGAHYDAAEGTPGADDNASGVASLLELARLLGQQPPGTRVELVAFTLEEPPFFGTAQMGSYLHAQSLRKERVNVRAMLSLEMLGYYSDQPESQQYPLPGLRALYSDRGDFIAIAGRLTDANLVRRVKESMLSVPGVPVYSISAPEETPGISLSDNQSYWAHDYNAVMITDTSFFRNHNYHQVGDLPETLDYERMAKVVKQVYVAVTELAR
jgi:hypothetical protein